MKPVSHGLDRLQVTFDEPGLVADAGLVVVATLASRLDLEALIDDSVRFTDRAGGFRPGRKVLTLVHAMVAGASHIGHADRLRSGATGRVLGHRVMACRVQELDTACELARRFPVKRASHRR